MKLWWKDGPAGEGLYLRATRVGDDWEYGSVRVHMDEGETVAEDLASGNTWNVWPDGSKWFGPIRPPRISTAPATTIEAEDAES
ncbi:MAG: hypothetical protein JXP34_26770 [Planctomycetes bacterium]|nr:hypothetical protein [Planctomycetota bacterium]